MSLPDDDEKRPMNAADWERLKRDLHLGYYQEWPTRRVIRDAMKARELLRIASRASDVQNAPELAALIAAFLGPENKP